MVWEILKLGIEADFYSTMIKLSLEVLYMSHLMLLNYGMQLET